jgi:hypothetical protein
MEQNFLNIALTEEQARFAYEVFTKTSLPFAQVAPLIEAFGRAGEEFQAKMVAQRKEQIKAEALRILAAEAQTESQAA